MERRGEKQGLMLQHELVRRFEEIPHTIYILGGGVKKLPNSDRYMSSPFPKQWERGSNGAFFRMYAVADYVRLFPSTRVITSGGPPFEDAPSSAEVMQKELIKYGISPLLIEKREHPTSTSLELVEVLREASELRSSESDTSSLWVCTNEYHIPRSEEMFRRLSKGDISFLPQSLNGMSEEVAEISGRISDVRDVVRFVPAERILAFTRPGFETTFAKNIESLDTYRKRLKFEEQGIANLKNGTYDTTKSQYK